MENNLSIIKDKFKELPNNIEAEQSVIGSILVTNEIFDEINTIISSINFFQIYWYHWKILYWLWFFKSFCDSAKTNLNIKATGSNEHHKIESIFKSFSKAIKMAISKDFNNMSLPTTKGKL